MEAPPQMKSNDAPLRVALKNILVATDFSAASHAAVLHALSLARRYGSTVYFGHAVRPEAAQPKADPTHLSETADQAWREGHRLTTDLLVSGQLRGIANHLLVGEGEIWSALSRMVQEHDIDLLVVGTRGRTGIRKMLMGSVAERIFRQATCPVLTVGPRAENAPLETLRQVLYATDFTPHSLYAAAYAFSLAQHYGASLTLVHVAPEAEAGAAVSRTGAIEEAQARLRALVPADAGLPSQPELVVEFGTPAARILEVAARRPPDLIVLGVRRPVTLAGRLPWSTASEVVGKAACPVLTVRAPFDE